MNAQKRSAKLALSLVVLLVLASAIIAFTQRESPLVTQVPICVKGNGQMRMLVEQQGCDSSERLVEWVVGGEVTDIQIGQGLIGTRNGGSVQLAVDPSVVGTGGGLFAGFNDGPGDIFGGFGGEFVAANFLGNLNLPAGNFAIFAKLTLRNVDSIDQRSHPVRCKLDAGVDFDEAMVVVEDEQDRNDNGTPDRDAASSLVMSLMVVHHFDAPGGARLFCSDGSPPNEFGTGGDDGDVKYEDLKIIAIKTSSISNVFLNN